MKFKILVKTILQRAFCPWKTLKTVSRTFLQVQGVPACGMRWILRSFPTQNVLLFSDHAGGFYSQLTRENTPVRWVENVCTRKESVDAKSIFFSSPQIWHFWKNWWNKISSLSFDLLSLLLENLTSRGKRVWAFPLPPQQLVGIEQPGISDCANVNIGLHCKLCVKQSQINEGFIPRCHPTGPAVHCSLCPQHQPKDIFQWSFMVWLKLSQLSKQSQGQGLQCCAP